MAIRNFVSRWVCRNDALIVLAIGVFWGMASVVRADVDYQQKGQDAEQLLNQTEALYRERKSDQAKEILQKAYFEDFESLEPPIRIHISAQKSTELESAFGEIRRMIGDNKPESEVSQKIQWLKSEIDRALPSLKGGHQLQGEEAHDAYNNDHVPVAWQQALKKIEDLLAEALTLYREDKFQEASEKVQQAQFEGFKNSELEIAVRRYRSQKAATEINGKFFSLVRLSERPGQLNEFSYEITGLLQSISDLLPNLPSSRDTTTPDVESAVDNVSNADWSHVARQINEAIANAIAQYQNGQDKEAVTAVQNAYFDLFEKSGLENKIGSRDAAFKSTLEGYFTRIVSLMEDRHPVEKLQEQAGSLRKGLDTAVTSLGKGDQSDWDLFLYSLLIIVREGLEALLIVAAIIAYLVKNNHSDKLPLIRQSVIVALAASLVTAVLFQWLFSNSGASRELLEGITMLIAVMVLFYMSHWLLAKTEAKRWKAYLEGKLSVSLSRGSLIGLWITSFLAVYREGAETTLFYYALFGDASRMVSKASVLGGFAVGCAILFFIYIVMRFTVAKLPLKPFFLFTGWFMYAMAFVFAGKGVLELVEGKLFKLTLIPGFPEIRFLGIYPYIETLTPQILLILVAIGAIWIERRHHEKDIPRKESLLTQQK